MRTGRQNIPAFMNPAIFIASSVLVGILFAFQEWISLRHMGYHMAAPIFFESWGFQFLVWGAMCWLLWRFLGTWIQRATAATILTVFLPLSILTSVAQQMLFVFIFRNLPLNHAEMSYWQRLSMYVYAELLDNMLIFWCAFLLFRGIGYYQRYREQEQAKSELEIQLANAQLAALRMQLNPHFLFNTMNSISSLMRSDVEAADTMLEQLSCLLRLSLERGESQLVSLREELDFIELYLGMQGQRYAGRVIQTVCCDPELYDTLVPSMLLQPIVENAYVHGISKTEADGVLAVEARRDGDQLRIGVRNSGIGLKPRSNGRRGVGLRNIESRLKLHYGRDATFEIAELDQTTVKVTIVLPLQYSTEVETTLTRFGTP
ncbi:MAG: histidine kinase [Acidobacteria bacterium]|nr:histidine kinase [Acidobacteriota bacterium]